MVFCIVAQVCNDAGPTDVKVSILIRSMGPISDVDMVSHIIQVLMAQCTNFRLNSLNIRSDHCIADILNGLLLPPVLEGQQTQLQGA